MKITVKALVLGIIVAGASAALATSNSRVPMVKSHQAVVSAAPIPTCGPSGCNGTGKGSGIQAVVSAAPIPTCGPSGCNGTGKGSGTH